MSIASRARNTKQPSPESGNPRRFGLIQHRARIRLTDDILGWHAATKGSGKPRKKHGAFGGVTLAARKQRIAAALVTQ